jgi:hypothetical protein
MDVRGVEEPIPTAEREGVRPGEQPQQVDAVQRDDRQRRKEEDDEPAERQAEQCGCRQVEPAAAPGDRRRSLGGPGLDGQPFTSAQAFAYSARFAMLRSRYAFGSVTARGFVSWSALSSWLELGLASTFACP